MMWQNRSARWGYNVETNVEYMDSMKKADGSDPAVLGGIGAISLIVAKNRNCKIR